MRNRHAFIAAILFLLVSLACESTVRGDRSDVRVGMARTEVSDHMGEPDEKRTMFKQTEHIWGPPEEWWHEVAMGDSLEVWTYAYPGEGAFDVYYVQGADTVTYTTFTPEGVVY